MKIIEAIIRTLFERNRLSKEELQARIDRNLEYLHQIRPPEAAGVMDDYLLFIGRYDREHPNASFREAHDACMKSHPEYWPRTLPQKPQSAYSS